MWFNSSVLLNENVEEEEEAERDILAGCQNHKQPFQSRITKFKVKTTLKTTKITFRLKVLGKTYTRCI